MKSRTHSWKRLSTVIPPFGVETSNAEHRLRASGFGGRDGFDRPPSHRSDGLNPRRRHPTTGIPRNVQRAAELRSGISMDDVRVTYNAQLPGTVGARAVTKGSRIAIAPGEESNVAHELWHVAQQKLRNVTADTQRNGQFVNTDASLEREADSFGDEAMKTGATASTAGIDTLRSISASGLAPMQLVRTGDSDSEDEPPAKKRRVGTKEKPEKKPVKKKREKKPERKPEKKTTTPAATAATPSKAKAEPKAKPVAKATDAPVTPTWDAGVLADSKVKQQGQFSLAHGKSYAGLVSLKRKRAAQVVRHVTNLTLNLANEAQAAKDVKRVDSRGRPVLDSKKKQIVDRARRPVEVQASAVGKRLLINSNNRESTQSIISGIGSGSLFDYVQRANARKPALDSDKERPTRYQSKLNKAKAKSRPWQKANVTGEDDADLRRTESILAAIQTRGIGTFDLSKPDSIATELEKWKDGSAPSVYAVLHADEKSKEHAERVQTRFRSDHLEDFEDENSTKPVGPKTTCLGCTSFHRADYPDHADHSEFTGAYFKGGSPAETPEQIKVATDLATKRPSTGSLSQHGYIRNSDYPDSDTDDEGAQVYPRPRGFNVAHGGTLPKEWTWDVDSASHITVPAKDWKQAKVARQHRLHPGESVAYKEPKKRAPRTPSASPPTLSASAKKRKGVPVTKRAPKTRKADDGTKVKPTRKRSASSDLKKTPAKKKRKTSK